MRTVVEYPEFIKKAEKIFGAGEREAIVAFLSLNPKAGKKLERFGGIRSLQWKDQAEHNIYFHSGTNNLPLTVIAIFRKNEKLVLEKLIDILIHSKFTQS